MVFNYLERWVEFFFFCLLVIGFLFSLLVPSAVLSYLVIVACGMMAGRLFYQRKNKLMFPYFLIIVGFLIGFILGAQYGDKIVIVTLFVIASFFGYYIHDKGLVHDIRY